MPPLTPEQIQYIASAVLLLLFGAMGKRLLAAVERIPEQAWFDRVEEHMKRGHDHANFIQAHAYRLANAEEALRKGRVRMDKIDAHLEATDARVDSHETRIAVLGAK